MKRIRKILAQACVIGLGLSSTVMAQDCSYLLQFGIYDHQDLKFDAERSKWFLDRFCSRSSNYEDTALKLGIKNILEADGSGKKGSLTEYCQNKELSEDEKTSLRIVTKQGSTSILEAHNRCIEQSGLHVWLQPTSDKRYFRIRAALRDASQVTVSFGLVGVASCSEFSKRQLSQGIKLTGAGRNITCKRETDKRNKFCNRVDYRKFSGHPTKGF